LQQREQKAGAEKRSEVSGKDYSQQNKEFAKKHTGRFTPISIEVHEPMPRKKGGLKNVHNLVCLFVKKKYSCTSCST